MPVVAAEHPIPPPARVPGIVPLREYVAAGDGAAIMLLEIRAYSQGCLAEFVALARCPDGRARESARIPPEMSVVIAGETMSGGDVSADGQRAVHRLDPPPEVTERLVRHTVLLWITPLPPVEPSAVRLDWPALGIHDASTVLDGQAIRQAAWDSFPLLPA
jgi:hypothetical protein